MTRHGPSRNRTDCRAEDDGTGVVDVVVQSRGGDIEANAYAGTAYHRPKCRSSAVAIANVAAAIGTLTSDCECSTA
jgi:hypothetical protein